MTRADVDALTAAPATAEVLTPTLRRRLRSGRGRLIAAGVVFAAAVLAVVLFGQAAQQLPPLDPGSAAPSGAKALVSVLREHGVDVRTAATLDAADAASSGVDPADLTVAVYDPSGFLSTKKLVDDPRIGRKVVLIEPVDPGAQAALTAAGHEVAVVRDASALQNQHILEGSNAGHAVRLFGSTQVLVWYTPSFADAGVAAPATIADVTPPWVTPLVVLCGAVALAAALWRGRRFGPLVVEDLPVVVRASESLEGRARLYQRSDARLHALDALRMGAVGRLATRLGLGPEAGVTDVCAAVAAQLARDPAEVRRTLVDGAPADDREFLELARGVAALEASLAPGRTRPPVVDASTTRVPEPDFVTTREDRQR
ncbi:MAG: DUF4350 domain-containing protein [Microbacteriaceae bacterium]|nr:DUF4350 domain-containing protein [Microbacteriaceae bacterium]MCL2794589.1 DUF4350 domain-containing protein [Microbacteriaceae bacterium]